MIEATRMRHPTSSSLSRDKKNPRHLLHTSWGFPRIKKVKKHTLFAKPKIVILLPYTTDGSHPRRRIQIFHRNPKQALRLYHSLPHTTGLLIFQIQTPHRSYLSKYDRSRRTSTRLKSRDSRTPRRRSTWREPKLHYSKRTPAGIAPGRQTADLPGMVCPLVLHDSLPFYGLSFRGVTDQRPVSCTCNRRSGFCPLCRINMFSGKRWFTGYSGRTCRLSESKAYRT